MQSATPLDTITVQAEADAALTPPASQLPTPAAPSLAGDTDPAHASLWDRIMAAETHIAALVPAVNGLVAAVDPTTATRLEAVESKVAAAAPVVEELTAIGASAASQGHSLTSILGSLVTQLFGWKL